MFYTELTLYWNWFVRQGCRWSIWDSCRFLLIIIYTRWFTLDHMWRFSDSSDLGSRKVRKGGLRWRSFRLWQAGQKGEGWGRTLDWRCGRSPQRCVRALGRFYWTEAGASRRHAAIEGTSWCARERGGDRGADWGSGTTTGTGFLEDEGGVCQTALVTTEWRLACILNNRKNGLSNASLNDRLIWKVACITFTWAWRYRAGLWQLPEKLPRVHGALGNEGRCLLVVIINNRVRCCEVFPFQIWKTNL